MTTLVQEKANQIPGLLAENNIDMWLTFVRETSAGGDPILPLIYGTDLTWQSALIFTQSGEKIAIVGRFEAEAAKRIGAYNSVFTYDESIRQLLLDQIRQQDPATIAINYSVNDVHADGLSYGLFKILKDYFSGTPFSDRLVSAEPVIRGLRGRKTKEEISRITAAIHTTDEIYQQTFAYAQPGMSEIQISQYMQKLVKQRELGTAWELDFCPTVNAGPDTPMGHVGPTDLQVQPGQLLHFDFGIKQDDYCSDIQRVMYFLAPDETAPPPEVQKGFDTIVLAIQEAVKAMKPGMIGKDVDAIARDVVINAGYPEFKYATGHQLGREAHDGGALLGPEWERYGETPNLPLEAGHVYTVEPGLMVDGYGYIGIEEDVLITQDGCEYLHEPQTELIVK